ncbi:hypothetical protein CBR_g70725 [Chara braunii]|uniref:Secreted protein n=1 Tax=Chara braunii TaxID=69332 RepID=A0A388K9W6_CHABU|nr:hypothetical protein CBR_g70725 [Chara braunii]|eukprot:GBG66848.1 hypothetical protein CBR_g70725 [Chara braunii]
MSHHHTVPPISLLFTCLLLVAFCSCSLWTCDIHCTSVIKRKPTASDIARGISMKQLLQTSLSASHRDE